MMRTHPRGLFCDLSGRGADVQAWLVLAILTLVICKGHVAAVHNDGNAGNGKSKSDNPPADHVYERQGALIIDGLYSLYVMMTDTNYLHDTDVFITVMPNMTNHTPSVLAHALCTDTPSALCAGR